MIDLNKPLQTRDGSKVRNVDPNGGDSKQPIAADVQQKDGSWTRGYFCRNGRFWLGTTRDKWDLVNVKASRWVNLYTDGGILRSGVLLFKTRRGAKRVGRKLHSNRRLTYSQTVRIKIKT